MSSSLGVRQWFPAGDLARHTREFGIEFVGDDDKEEDGVLKTECVSPPPATLPPIPPLIPLSTEEPLASDDSDEPGAYGGVFMVNSESPVFGDSAVNMCSEKGCCAGDTSQCSVVLDPLPSELLRSLTEDGRISVEKASREQCSSGESVLATQDRIDCAEESRDSRRGARQRKRRRESSGGGKGKRRKRSTSSSTTSSTGSTASRPHHYHHKHHKHRRRLCKTADEGSPPPIPRVNPIFLWVKQDDTRIVEVLCEDYDKRNRIRLTKTPHGWRAIPRTERLASVSQTAPSCTINCSVEAPLDGEQCDNSPIDGSIDHCGATLVPTNVDHPAPVAEDENSTDQVTKEHEEGGGEVEEEGEGDGEGESEGEVEAGAEGEGRGEGEGEENDAEEQGEECPETEVNGEDTCHSSTRELQDCTDTEVEEMEPTDLSIPKTITDTDNIPLKTITPILPAALNPHPTSEEAAPTPAHQPKPQRKSMFLESLLSSPRKCYEPPRQPNDEPQPLDLGVCPSRGLGSPTISFSEEKKITATPDSEITLKTKNLKAEDITLKNLLSKHSSKAVERSSTPEVIVETTKTQKSRLLELLTSEPLSLDQEVDPLTQLKKVLSDPELSVPDPMLVPRDQLRRLVASPAREIPRLLSMRPELRIPEALAYPGLVQDPDLLVVSLTHLQRLLQNWTEEDAATCMSLCEYQMYQQQQEATTSELKQQQNGDLAAALNQMLWLPYLTQLETAAMTCGNNQEFLTMLNAVFPPSTYPQIQGGTAQQQQYPFLIPFTLPSTDYKTQLEFQQALLAWHEAMMQAAVSAASVTNNPLPSGKNASGTNSYIKTHHHCPTNGRFPHVARKFNSSSARTSPISPTFQSHAPNATHEYLAANGYTNNHHHQYNQYRSRHHQQQQQQPARNNSGPPKLPKSETQTPIDSDKGPKVTCNSLINILSNPNKQQQQEESVTVKRCLSPTMQSQHSHLLAALGNPPSNLPHLVPIPQGISPPAPIDLSGRRPGDKMAVTTGKLKVKKHLVDPAITPRLLKQEVESISPTDKTSHPQLWHPLFGSQKTPYTSPWQWTTVMVNGE